MELQELQELQQKLYGRTLCIQCGGSELTMLRVAHVKEDKENIVFSDRKGYSLSLLSQHVSELFLHGEIVFLGEHKKIRLLPDKDEDTIEREWQVYKYLFERTTEQITRVDDSGNSHGWYQISNKEEIFESLYGLAESVVRTFNNQQTKEDKQ